MHTMSCNHPDLQLYGDTVLIAGFIYIELLTPLCLLHITVQLCADYRLYEDAADKTGHVHTQSAHIIWGEHIWEIWSTVTGRGWR